MNTFSAIGTYQGEIFQDNGLRFIKFNLPKVGKSGTDVPLLIVPNRAAGETFDVFQEGARILVTGRLYPNRHDYKMYVVPNAPITVVADKTLQYNRVNLAGGVGYIPENQKEDLFIFTLMCSAPTQTVLNHTWEDSLSFKMESWGDDARRLSNILHVGRQVAVEGILRYNVWTAQDGSTRGSYQVRVRSGLYSAFGKNKKREEQQEVRSVVTGNQNQAPETRTVEPYNSVVMPSVAPNSAAVASQPEVELPF